jgi:hypothetical protein
VRKLAAFTIILIGLAALAVAQSRKVSLVKDSPTNYGPMASTSVGSITTPKSIT